jgi:hypothetical protein
MSNCKKPVIIWSPVKGTWYQEVIDERLSLSFLGWVRDREELEEFCSKHRIDFVIYQLELEEVAPASCGLRR